MSIYRHLKPLFALACSAATAIAAPPRWETWDNVQALNSDWHYIESNAVSPPMEGTDSITVTLPHSWNAKDTLTSKDYRQDASWYVKNLEILSATLPKEQRYYLRFEGAGQSAEVFFNGQAIAQHVGGYTAFTCELTPHLSPGKNRVAIRVSNAHDKMRIPLSGDFNQYGGLYRKVTLITAPVAGFSRNELGGTGIHVWNSELTERQATTQVKATLSNGSSSVMKGTIVAELLAPDGKLVARAQQAVQIDANENTTSTIAFPAIQQPQLWSPESPALYTLKLTLVHDGKPIDHVRVQHGFRWFVFTPNEGFFLNGKPYRLIGTNRHQDREGFGNALSDDHHNTDLELMKEIGVNYLRLAHYPQNDYILQRCNELGILVEEEIPFVNNATFEPEFEKNTYTMAKEMVTQHINHPCVIVWGMGNEIHMQDRGDGKARCYDMISNLHQLIHQLDPTRKTLLVSNDSETPSKLGVMDIPDLNGYNIYQGWYGENLYGLTDRLKHLHQLNPDKPILVTEFGAGSDRRLHSATPARYDFTEEYQVVFLEAHFDQMDKMPWLAGFNWWAFADFGSSQRRDSIPHVNQKGLVTFSREKKDAFYLWKARFGKEPVLHLQSSAWTERYGPAEITSRVFTNFEEVELIHNGKSLGTKTKDFTWPITMTLGKNTLTARSGKTEDKVSFDYKGAKKFLNVTNTSSTRSVGKNLSDDSSFTHWFGRTPAFIEIDLETPALIDAITIEPYQGTEQTYLVKVSGRIKDGEKWHPLWSGETTLGKEFIIPQEKQVEWRYLRIDSEKTDTNRFLAINELRLKTSTERQEKSLYERKGLGK